MLMSKIRRFVFASVVAIAVVAAVVSSVAGIRALRIAAAATSKTLCSATFVSGVSADQVFQEELHPQMRSIGWGVRYHVDRKRKRVVSRVLGLFTTRALYHPVYGCVLADNTFAFPEDDVGKLQSAGNGADVHQGAVPLPLSSKKMKSALDLAFSEPDPLRPRHTKAVLVWHKGGLVAERYAPGYGPETKIWAHSVTKSIAHALTGVLVQKGLLELNRPLQSSVWNVRVDERKRAVTADHLLRMTSGLPFDETGSIFDLSHRMFFSTADMAHFAGGLSLSSKPETTWQYSNAGYVLLGRIARDLSGGTAESVFKFMKEELFEPVGMHHTAIELDSTGTPVLGSHAYASARDLARLGQLYLDDGIVDGEQILPPGWAAHARAQTLDTGYGAGFWTMHAQDRTVPVWETPWGLPGLPEAAYFGRGALGQYLIVLPDEELIIVRLGTSVHYGTGIDQLVSAVREAVVQ